jgi:hypothetical protein
MVGAGRLSSVDGSKGKIDSLFRSMQLHVGYLLSMEDSERARLACVRYLNNWSSEFYPERSDIFERAKRLAESLGGRVDIPQLDFKYSWISRLAGPAVAKNARRQSRRLKLASVRSWDRLLSLFENVDGC